VEEARSSVVPFAREAVEPPVTQCSQQWRGRRPQRLQVVVAERAPGLDQQHRPGAEPHPAQLAVGRPGCLDGCLDGCLGRRGLRLGGRRGLGPEAAGAVGGPRLLAQRVVVEAQQAGLHLGEGEAGGLEPLDRDELEQVAAPVQGDPATPSGGPVHQAERGVVADRPAVGQVADPPAGLAVVAHGEGGGRLGRQLVEGPPRVDCHVRIVTLST
jgi:hypothetical protein